MVLSRSIQGKGNKSFEGTVLSTYITIGYRTKVKIIQGWRELFAEIDIGTYLLSAIPRL